MECSFNFSIIRLCPDERRGEVVNIGICVFGEARLDVRVLASMRKVQALRGDIDVAALYELPQHINDWAKGVTGTTEQYELLRDFGMISLSEPGAFFATDASYETAVAGLMDKLVVPTAPRHSKIGEMHLASRVRRLFDREKMLGGDIEDIKRHLVVPRYPISEEKELWVDFALKNAVYHVTETIDFRVKRGIRGIKKKEAGSVALTLHEAKLHLGPDMRRFVIYAAPARDGDNITPHLAVLGS